VSVAPIALGELATSQLDELREDGSSETSNRIPTTQSGEALRLTADGTATGDVCEALEALGVNPWVKEAQRRLARGNERVVDQRNNTGHQGGGSGGAANDTLGSVPEVLPMLLTLILMGGGFESLQRSIDLGRQYRGRRVQLRQN
jgi:hypothetical protein